MRNKSIPGKSRILSRSDEPFQDRREAGLLLAKALVKVKGKGAIILGVPRGGVVVAQALAEALDAELDIVLSRKLRTPGQPELAMGSVSEDGKVFLNETVVRGLGISEAEIEQEKAAQMAEMARRNVLFRKVKPRVPLAGRIAVITDDGVATGATTQAAIWAARHEKPQELIAAIPVGSDETIRRLAEDVDEMVCLRTPPFFAAVGQFYINFSQVSDEEVLEILRESVQRSSQ